MENNDPMPTLKEKLAFDRFIITAEIAPPVSCDALDLMAKAAPTGCLVCDKYDVMMWMNPRTR